MASRTKLALFAGLVVLACSGPVHADKLQITSTPPGATVELDGVAVGTTPFEKRLPGGYFHKTRTVLGTRLQHAMVARVTLAGYATQEIKLTEGPMNWVSLKGRNRGEYWLLKSDHFHIDLQPISDIFTGAVTANLEGATAALQASVNAPPVQGTSQAPTDGSSSSAETPVASPPGIGEGSGTVSITSEPDGAEIFVDDKFHGNTPATLRLSAGSHEVVLKFPKHEDWRRTLEVLKSSKTSLKAALDPAR